MRLHFWIFKRKKWILYYSSCNVPNINQHLPQSNSESVSCFVDLNKQTKKLDWRLPIFLKKKSLKKRTWKKTTFPANLFHFQKVHFHVEILL